MSKFLTFSFFLIVFTGYTLQVTAQCSPTAPAEGACSGGNGVASDGANINNGQTYWYSGTGTFSNGVNLNDGGTLRVCGNLTLGQINLNGGTIIIATGGTLTVNGGGTLNLNNNVTIANYGTLNINRDVLLQNSNNAIINASSAAVINMANNKLTISGSSASSGNILINKGSVFLSTLEVTSNSNGVCVGNQSRIETKDYINSKTNAFTVEPGGVAVLRFTQTGQNNAPLAATPDLHICKATGATFTGSNNVGAATTYDNCGSSSLALPITLSSFQIRVAANTAVLVWETAREKDNDYFVLEHGTDGVHFSQVSEQIPGVGTSENRNRYTWVDYAPAAGINYYRLKQVDLDGTVFYHGIRSAKIEKGASTAEIFPNPASQWVTIRLSDVKASGSTVLVTDMTGRQVIHIFISEGQERTEMDISGLPAGNYLLNISNDQFTQSSKLVKQ